MSPKQKKAYNQMRDHMIAELDGKMVSTVSPLTKSQRMLQFASSYAEAEEEGYVDKETGETKIRMNVTLKAPSNKIDAFMSDLEDFGANQVVVFAASKQLINLLSERMTKQKIHHGLITGDISNNDRQVDIDRFQAGKIQFMLCTTGAGGTGLTLTAANVAVFLQLPWSMIELKQAQDRIHRIGSEIHESITYVYYVSTGTLDEEVITSQGVKAERLEEILQDGDLFRRVIEGK